MLLPPSPDDARQLRDFFREAQFRHEQLQHNPLLREFPNREGIRPSLLERTRVSSVTDLLVRWFFLGLSEAEDGATKLVGEPVLRILTESGLLRREEGRLTPTVMITPWADYLFVSDPESRLHAEHSAEVVVWPNPTTLALQRFAIHDFRRSTLDLGTGCGIQAITAAAHSERVCATDLNPRAAEFVDFNTHLNAVNNVDCLIGDTFEPIQDRTFDLILANLPFFVTPSAEYLYSENSMHLDQYCRRVVREGAEHLNEGGYLQAVLEWVQIKGETWRSRLASWLEGTQCDAWILHGYARDAGRYAQERIETKYSREEWPAKFDNWMTYYQERGVEEIHGGLLAMRRRSGRNWLRIEELSVDPAEAFGDTVLDLFATQDILSANLSDAELLGMKPRLSANTQLHQKSTVSGGKWTRTSLALELGGALPVSQAVEPAVADFLSQCDGTKTLEELAGILGTKVNVTPGKVREQCCTIVRRLAQQRFIQILK